MTVTEKMINHMVNRFLNWKLPANFNPDGGISFQRYYNQNTPWPAKHEPSGTNLFDAKQAEVMVRHMLDGLPALAAAEPSETVADLVTDEELYSPTVNRAWEEYSKNLKPSTMTFSSDDDALEFLKTYGHEESQNGVIRGDWRSFDADCRAAVRYLCDEWDFVFEHATPTPSPADRGAVEALIRSVARPVIDELSERFAERPGNVDDYADYMGRIPDAIIAAITREVK